MSGELWAAWVSAGGSLLAIGVSVWLHYASLSDRKAADATAARNAALVVLPKFNQAAEDLSWSLSRLREGRNPNVLGSDESGDIGIGRLRRAFDRFEPTIESIGQLGRAAAPAQAAYQLFRELSVDLAAYIAPDHFPGDPVAYEGEAWTKTSALIQRTEEKVRGAVAEIVSLLR